MLRLRSVLSEMTLWTASPENPASVRSFLHEGYRIVETKPMYGGLLRHIFYKAMEQRREDVR